MKRIEFNKIAGYFHPMDGWEVIEEFWPLKKTPTFNKKACSFLVDDRPAFPVSTPEDALASQMIFLKAYADGMIEKEAAIEIGSRLKEVCEAWEVRASDEYIDHIFSKEAEENYYLDDDENLPFSDREGFLEATNFFCQNKDGWSVPEQIKIACEIRRVAEIYDVDVDVKGFRSDFAKEAVELRELFIRPLTELDGYAGFMEKLASIKSDLDSTENNDIVKLAEIAETLHELDIQSSISSGWDKFFPGPYETIMGGVEIAPAFGKMARQEYDWEKLATLIEPSIVDQIKEDPDSIIPTLPIGYKAVLDDCKI